MRNKTDQHTTQEWTQLRTLLVNKGMQAFHIAATIGASPGTRNRQQIEQILTTWLKTRPKG